MSKRSMEKWEVRINLRFPRIPWRFPVGFTYEWKAWLIAYDLKGMEPTEFLKVPLDEQINALAYAAAAWHLIKKGKKVFFTPEDISKALLRASRADNLRLVHAMSYAQFPDWLKDHSPKADDKKKEQT